MRDKTYILDLEEVRAFSPERILLVAILDRALRDLQGKDTRAEALRWFHSGSFPRTRKAFTYLQILDYLEEYLGEKQVSFIEERILKAKLY